MNEFFNGCLIGLVWIACGFGLRAIYQLGKAHHDAKHGGGA